MDRCRQLLCDVRIRCLEIDESAAVIVQSASLMTMNVMQLIQLLLNQYQVQAVFGRKYP